MAGSRREAVSRVIKHEEVWPVPYLVRANALLDRALQERLGFADFSRFVGNYLVWELATPNVPSGLQGDRYADIWGITWAGVGFTRGVPVRNH